MLSMSRAATTSCWFRWLPDRIERRRKHVIKTTTKSTVDVEPIKQSLQSEGFDGTAHGETLVMGQLSQTTTVNSHLGRDQSANSQSIILRRQAIASSNKSEEFGFTLRGACPVVVGHVTEGSAADRAGLRQGDRVEKVNGRNVSCLAADSVAQIVRCCNDVIIIDVNRTATEPKALQTTPTDRGRSVLPRTDDQSETIYESINTTSENNSHSTTINRSTRRVRLSRAQHQRIRRLVYSATSARRRKRASNTTTSMAISSSSSLSSNSCSGGFDSSSRNRDSGYEGCRSSELADPLPTISDESETDGGSNSILSDLANGSKRTLADEQNVTRTKFSKIHFESNVDFCHESLQAQLSKASSSSTFECADDENREPDVLDCAFLLTSYSSSAAAYSVHRQRLQPSSKLWNPDVSVIRRTSYCDDVTSDTPTQLLPLKNEARAVRGTPVRTDSVSGSSDRRNVRNPCRKLPAVYPSSRPLLEVIHSISQCERSYVDDLAEGVSRLSCPLRHNGFFSSTSRPAVISREQHEILFQNIDKLLVTSEFIVRRLDVIAESDDPLMDVSHLYSEQMCLAYKSYFSGLSSALRQLSELQSNDAFGDFLQMASYTMRKVENVLCRPVLHVRDIRYWLSRLLCASAIGSSSSPQSRDAFCFLNRVLTCLDDICAPKSLPRHIR